MTSVNDNGKTKSDFDSEMESLKAIEKRRKEDLEAVRQAIRVLAEEMSNAAPYACATCGLGVWSKDDAHTHFNVLSRRRTPYRATLFKRPTP